MDERPLLYNYFNEKSKLMLAEYNISKQQGSYNNLGKNRELICSEFLRKVLPQKLKVTSGEIWDYNKKKTGQIDIIILREDAPALDFGQSNSFLAEGVYAVIEVKSNLTKTKLKEAGESLKKVQELNINSTSKPLKILFAYIGNNLEIIEKNMFELQYDDNFDLICILNKGIILKKGLIINWQNDSKFCIIKSKATALSFLYALLVNQSYNYLRNPINLQPYFEPIPKWSDD